MIEVGSFRSRDCHGVSRRSLLRCGASLPFVASSGGLVNSDVPKSAGPARSVILLWLWGGPSHLDTFDPKPEAPLEIRGPFATLATRTPGVQVSELFPGLAARSDRFSIVRSHHNHTAIHRVAGSIALSGDKGASGDSDYGPTVGSIVQRHRGGDGALPRFVSITPGPLQTALGSVQGAGGGRWGRAYDPVAVRCSDTGQVDIPSLRLLEGLQLERLSDRRLLLGVLDRSTSLAADVRSAAWSDSFTRDSTDPRSVWRERIWPGMFDGPQVSRSKSAVCAGQLEPVRREHLWHTDRFRMGHALVELRTHGRSARADSRPGGLGST